MESFTQKHRVEYYECDFQGHLKISTILALFISVATQHNDTMQVGTNKAKQLGGGWIIIGYDGQFYRSRPVDNELITVGTSLVAYNRFFVIRQFELRNHCHQLIAAFRGCFAFIDLTKRRLMPIPVQIYQPFRLSASKHLPRLKTPKKATVTAQWQKKDYQVCSFDIDFNHHVSNTRYIDWMLDPLGEEFLCHHCLKRLVVRYGHEIRDGMRVQSLVSPAIFADNQLKTYHQVRVPNQTCARGEAWWN